MARSGWRSFSKQFVPYIFWLHHVYSTVCNICCLHHTVVTSTSSGVCSAVQCVYEGRGRGVDAWHKKLLLLPTRSSLVRPIIQEHHHPRHMLSSCQLLILLYPNIHRPQEQKGSHVQSWFLRPGIDPSGKAQHSIWTGFYLSPVIIGLEKNPGELYLTQVSYLRFAISGFSCWTQIIVVRIWHLADHR